MRVLKCFVLASYLCQQIRVRPQKIASAPCVAAMLNAKQIRDLICPQKIASAPCVAAIL